MIRIANLKIEPNAIDYLPEALARENCVLPIRVEDGRIHVVIGRRADNHETIEKLRFVLNREIIGAVADFDRLMKAIDEVYSLQFTEIKNCPIDFRTPCPRNWLELLPTSQGDVRFCEGCRLPVYFCQDEAEAIRQASLGRCVAVVRAVALEHHLVDTYLVGDLQIVGGSD